MKEQAFSFGCILSANLVFLFLYLTPHLSSYNSHSQLGKTSTSKICCTRFPAKESGEPGVFQVCEVTATFKFSTCTQRDKWVGKEQMLDSLSSFRWSLISGSLQRYEHMSRTPGFHHSATLAVCKGWQLQLLRDEAGERETPYQTCNCLTKYFPFTLS